MILHEISKYSRYINHCGLIYICFNVTYILIFDGTNSENKEYIYSIMDWKKYPGSAIGLSFGLIIVQPLIFCLFYLFSMLRDYCWKKFLMVDTGENQTKLYSAIRPIVDPVDQSLNGHKK